jgi:mannosyl-3-phosphoglycerate phosphatase
MAQLIVFTDLDGTLLDAGTYSWRAAQPALDELRRRRIPLVFCSSKTRAEILPLRQELNNTDPFVAENGGAIYVPRNYFPFPLPAARKEADTEVLELGVPYARLVQALAEAAETSGVRVRGFSQMSDKEVAKLTDLPLAQARRARQREFDEPFLLEKGTAKQKEKFFNWLQQRGLRWREGGRFLHLMGDNDKGVAVRRLVECYAKKYSGRARTVGLGDSPNDLDFLAAVDAAVLVARPDGSHDPEARAKLPGARLVAAGPAGWNAAMEQLLRQ